MRSKTSNGVASLVVIFGVVCCLHLTEKTGECFQSDDRRSHDDEAWVREIEPGVRLYGRVPKFAEVGQSDMFDASPDGRTIVFVSGQEIKFWDIESERIEGNIKLKSGAVHVEYSPDGLRLFLSQWVSVPQDQPDDVTRVPVRPIVTVWDAITRERIATIDPWQARENAAKSVAGTPNQQRHIQALAIAPDGDAVALGFGNRTEIYDVVSGEKRSEVKHDNYVQFITFAKSGDELLDSFGRFFDIDTGDEKGKLPAEVFDRSLSSFKVAPKGNLMAATAWNREVILYDVDRGKVIDLQDLGEGDRRPQLYMIEFSNNGKLIAASAYANAALPGQGARLYVWNVDSGKLVEQFDLPGAQMRRMRFSADNERLFTKMYGEFGLSEWEIDGRVDQSEQSLRGNVSPISTFQFVGDQAIVAGSGQGAAVVYDLATGRPEDNIRQQQTTFLDVNENEEYLVIGGLYNAIQIRHLPTNKTRTINLRSFQRPSLVTRFARSLLRKNGNPGFENFATSHVQIAEEGRHVLVAGRSQRSFRIEKFELKSGNSVLRRQFKMKSFWSSDPGRQVYHWRPRSVAVARNGQWLAVVNNDNDIFVIDAESGIALNEVKGEFDGPCRLYFTPDSSQLLVAGGDKLRAWSTETGEAVKSIELNGSAENFAMAISRDGRRMAAVSRGERSQLKVIDLPSWEELQSEVLKDTYVAVGISAEGNRIALAKTNCQFEVRELVLSRESR